MARIIAITTLAVAFLILDLSGTDHSGQNCRRERARRVEVPPEKILHLVRDFHRQVFWTAYQNLNPVLERIERRRGCSETVQ